MNLADISIWGAILVLFLTAIAVAFFFIVDRRLTLMLVKALGIMAVQTIGVGLYMHLLYKADNWWLDLLWLALMSALVAYVALHRVHPSGLHLLIPVAGAVLGGCVVAGGSLMLCFRAMPSRQLLLPVAAVVLGILLTSTIGALRTYLASLRRTRDHRIYLLANGASHLESLIPSVRRALKASIVPLIGRLGIPVVVAMPMLFAGMLLGGVSPEAAAFSTVLVAAASIVATVVSAIMLFWLLDSYLFSKTGDRL